MFKTIIHLAFAGLFPALIALDASAHGWNPAMEAVFSIALICLLYTSPSPRD